MTDAPSKKSQAFLDYLAEKLPLVEEALRTAMPTPLAEATPADDLNRYLYAPLEHFTASGGKRVRPVLALLGTEAVGGRAEDALSSAVAVELFQSAALIHDDIADESELRRGEPCLYRAEGVGVATNVGDLALVEVFEVVLKDDSLPMNRKLTILQELVNMERHTLEGQALDLGWVRDNRWDVSVGDYVYMSESKTAWYSAAIPLYVGAIAGGATPDDAEGLLAVGLLAGAAFQLQDDLLNLVGDVAEQGKDFRSDITEGKRTLAVVWALEHLAEAERDELTGILEAKTSDEALLSRAVELINQGGGIEKCRQLALADVEDAQRLAHALAVAGQITNESRDILCSMADFFVERVG